MKQSAGGLGWTTGVVTALGLVLFAVLVGYLAISHRGDVEGTHAARRPERHRDDYDGGGAPSPQLDAVTD